MRIHYYIDPATGIPHIYQHGIYEDEVEDILTRPLQDLGEAMSRASQLVKLKLDDF